MVTDRRGPRPLIETVQAVLDGGGRWVWFRDKDLAPQERRDLAERLAVLVRQAGGVLSIGGDRELAALVGARGVHLGGGTAPAAVAEARRRLGPDAWVGVSAHAPRDVAAAVEGGADYVTLSPIFASASKPGYGPALGVSAIAEATRAGLPVIALGGIDGGHIPACRSAGTAGVAVMGGLMRAADPAAETRALLRACAAADRTKAALPDRTPIGRPHTPPQDETVCPENSGG